MARDTVLTIGALDQPLTVQSKTTSTDTQLGRSVTWSTYATIWGSVRAVSAGEQQQTEAITAKVRYEVESHYRTDILPTMRLQWTPFRASSARTLQINGVRIAPGRPERIVMDCEEVAP